MSRLSSTNYAVKIDRVGDIHAAVITATNPKAKDQFFAWGSDRDAIDGSFYGNSVGKHYGNPDYTPWRWRLTRNAVDRMIHNIADNINNPDYYPPSERRIAKELLGVLRRCKETL